MRLRQLLIASTMLAVSSTSSMTQSVTKYVRYAQGNRPVAPFLFRACVSSRLWNRAR
jgi:hypothetical protein